MVVPAPGVGWGKVMNCGGQLLVKRGEKMNDHGYSIWEQFVALGGAGRRIFFVDIHCFCGGDGVLGLSQFCPSQVMLAHGILPLAAWIDMSSCSGPTMVGVGNRSRTRDSIQ